MKPRLVGCAAPHGYGPVSKLCRIAAALRPLGVSVVFLGSGIAHALASGSGAFDDVVDALPDSPAASALIDSAGALLSLMDRDYLAIAQDLDKPTFVADSLFWMRDRIPHPFLAATCYWVQNFFGVKERLADLPIAPSLVGPIVPPAAPRQDRQRSGIAVHLGGCDSPLSAIDADSGYLDFIVDGVAESVLRSCFPGPMVVMAGRRCADALRSRYRGNNIEFVSVSPDRALVLLDSAMVVLTAPGLTASLECFQLQQPAFFLPPQNYSQWWILNKLRAHGLAPGAFHWENCLAGSPVTERMAESERVPLLRSLIGGLSRDARARRSFVAALDGYAACDRDALAATQRDFFESLGANGLNAIVADLARFTACLGDGNGAEAASR